MEHEIMQYDLLIVGAGPAGLAAAIKAKQVAQTRQQDIRVCILEKGAQIGAHILSGAVLDPKSLMALLPSEWENAPLNTAATEDFFYYLTKKHAYRLPTPAPMKNKGNYIIRLGELCQFLAKHAELLGCEIYPGFAATKVLYNRDGVVLGVASGEVGVDKKGSKTDNYQPGIHIHAKQTLFAEGCRGQLSQQVMNRFQLRKHCQPQTYGLGIKELWHISPDKHHRGHVMHSVGWPMNQTTYGGSFVYHLADNLLAIGFVVGLDYQNPWLNPYEEFQRFKTHPKITTLLQDGERIAYGARALNEGGWQSQPKLTFPGGMIIGDAAGFLNVAKIKGIHTAMYSGMLAAEVCVDAILQNDARHDLIAFNQNVKASWIEKELYKIRNIRPGFTYGLWLGLANAAFETYLTRGRSPWTLRNHNDHTRLRPAKEAKKIEYPKHDGIITFDRLSSVYLSNTFHEENQPPHLRLRDPSIAIDVNYREYASPETRYCPSGVYEIVNINSAYKLQINAQNCIHCKTCDIKDPLQNIIWTAPEGGGGPNYIGM